jgi:hypothetical protein
LSTLIVGLVDLVLALLQSLLGCLVSVAYYSPVLLSDRCLRLMPIQQITCFGLSRSRSIVVSAFVIVASSRICSGFSGSVNLAIDAMLRLTLVNSQPVSVPTLLQSRLLMSVACLLRHCQLSQCILSTVCLFWPATCYGRNISHSWYVRRVACCGSHLFGPPLTCSARHSCNVCVLVGVTESNSPNPIPIPYLLNPLL